MQFHLLMYNKCERMKDNVPVNKTEAHSEKR